MNDPKNAETTDAAEKAPKPSSGPKGGKTNRKRGRGKPKDSGPAKQPKTAVEPPGLTTYHIAFGKRNAAFDVSLLGIITLAKHGLRQLSHAGLRPLSQTLANQTTRMRYLKTLAYVMRVKISDAQNQAGVVAGITNDISRDYTSDQLRTAQSHCTRLPSIIAWAIDAVGHFDYEGTLSVPQLRSSNERILCALSGDFPTLSAQITSADAVPEGQADIVQRINDDIDGFALTAEGLFSGETQAIWNNAIGIADWAAFDEVNLRAYESNLAVGNYNLLKGSGASFQAVRFEDTGLPTEAHAFYSQIAFTPIQLSQALCLRIGSIDHLTAEQQLQGRFSCNEATALIHGNDMPFNAITLAIQAMTRQTP